MAIYFIIEIIRHLLLKMKKRTTGKLPIIHIYQIIGILFLIRLILCPYCFSTVLSLFLCILNNIILYTLVVSYLACLFYFTLKLVIKLGKGD